MTSLVWAATIRRNAPYHLVAESYEVTYGGDPGDLRVLTVAKCERSSTTGVTMHEAQAIGNGMRACVRCWPKEGA